MFLSLNVQKPPLAPGVYTRTACHTNTPPDLNSARVGAGP